MLAATAAGAIGVECEELVDAVAGCTSPLTAAVAAESDVVGPSRTDGAVDGCAAAVALKYSGDAAVCGVLGTDAGVAISRAAASSLLSCRDGARTASSSSLSLVSAIGVAGVAGPEDRECRARFVGRGSEAVDRASRRVDSEGDGDGDMGEGGAFVFVAVTVSLVVLSDRRRFELRGVSPKSARVSTRQFLCHARFFGIHSPQITVRSHLNPTALRKR